VIRRTPILLSLIGVAGLSARPVLADDTHYQDFVIGGRAMVLGGAYVALADDPSGIYNNPAGIADVRHTSLQVSTSLYGFERSSIGKNVGVPVPGLETLDVKKFTEVIIVPASAGFVSTFGKKEADGLHRHTYGLSVMVPSYRSFSVSGDFGSYQRRVSDRELWSGVGYGYRVDDNWRIGISGYYVLRSVADREDVTVYQNAGPVDENGNPSSAQQRFQAVTNDVTFTNGSLLLIFGAKLRLAPGLSLGLALQSPSIQIHSQASLQFTNAASDPTTTPAASSTFTVLTPKNPRSETKKAAAVRFGGSYVSAYSYTITADVTVTAPVEYALINADQGFRSRLPFNPNVERKPVANVNLGAEYLIVREVSIGAGLFTDRSTAPHVRAAFLANDQQPHVDMTGLTLSRGSFGDSTLSRLGVVYSFGHGQDVIPVSDIGRVLEQDQTFQRVPYAQSFFYIFLSSTFRY
jgi:long-chain fatty acid transport protein